MLKSTLIATDFSGEAEAARHRAARIARETGTGGTLLHVLPASLPVEMHLQAAPQAQKALALLADEMARDGLQFLPRLASGEIADELAKAALGHDLIVAGARGEDLLLDFALGRTSTHLVQQSERPVLIVKRRPQEAYRRVVAAVDCTEPSFHAAEFGLQIAPNAEADFVHAFEVPYESSMRLGGATEDMVLRYRNEAQQQAMAAMNALVERLAPGARARQTVVRGYPSRVILECARRHEAELIIIGKHAAGIVERAMIGSVSLQVLEQAACDVLVVPEKAS